MRRYLPTWVFPVILVFSFATVWLRLAVVKATYNLSQTTKTLNNLKLENERLELQVTQARSPRILENLAKQKFQLHLPSPGQVIQMKE